jgi:hypothetical protein
VLNTNYPSFEVILIDDCSTDGSLELVKKIFGSDPRLKVTRNNKKSGPAASRNRGIKMAKGEYIAFIETDMEVDPNWLTELVKVLESDKTIGAAQSKVLDIKHQNFVQAVGIYIIPQTGWVINRGFGEEDNKGAHNDIKEVSMGAVGSVIKREVLSKVGNFDEKLVHNVDDIDLGWRVWLSGYRIVSVPMSITYHWTFKPGRIREKTTSRLNSEFHFNKIPRVFIKNYELKNLVKYLPCALIIMFYRAFINLVKKEPMPMIGLFKSILWNLRALQDTLTHRYRIQRVIRRVPDDYIMQKIMVKNLLIYRRYLSKVRLIEKFFTDVSS